MTEEKNDILAICSKEVRASAPHLYAVILHPNKKGEYEQEQTLDFTGETIWKSENVSSALFIPISRATSLALMDAYKEVTREVIGQDGKKALRGSEIFYFNNGANNMLTKEQRDRTPIDYDGTQKKDYGSASHHTQPLIGQQRAATNCCHWLFHTLEQVGGIPLNDIIPNENASCKPRYGSSRLIDDAMRKLSGYKKGEEHIQQHSCRNSHFIAYTATNHALDKTAIGSIMFEGRSLLSHLSDSIKTPPFHNPTINDGITEHPDYQPKPKTDNVSCDSSSTLIDNFSSQSIQ